MDKKKDLEKQITAEAKEVFAEASKNIFDKHGDIVHSFGWTQYTPYFNDGEPCVFGTGELFIISKTDKTNDEYEDTYYESTGEFGAYGTTNNKLAPYIWDWKEKYKPYSRHGEPDKPEEIVDRSATYEPGPNRATEIVGEVTKRDNSDYDPVYGEANDDIKKLFGLLDERTLETLFGDHVLVIVTADGVSVEDYDHD